MGRTSCDVALCEGRQFVGVSVTDPGQPFQGRLRLASVDLGQGEADVDEYPVAGNERLVVQQADVHSTLDALDADHRQVLAVCEDLDDLTGDPQAHAVPSLHRADLVVPLHVRRLGG